MTAEPSAHTPLTHEEIEEMKPLHPVGECWDSCEQSRLIIDYEIAVARVERAEAARVELRWWGEHAQSCFSPTFEAWKWLGVTPDELQRHVDVALKQPAAAESAQHG